MLNSALVYMLAADHRWQWEEWCDARGVPRQRITEAPRIQLSNPSWTDDPRFDLRRHVRHASLPAPGSRAQLRELVGDRRLEDVYFELTS